MATTPSQTPVASELPQDLKFNAGKIDEFVTSLALQYIDRFGGAHYTIEGLKQLVLQQIYNLGWNPVGTFQDGATVTGAGDILQDESTGVWYRWDDLATLPKTVPAGSTPDSTGGTGEGKWLAVDVNDVLRKELAEPTGAELVGAIDSDGNETTVQEAMNHYRGYTIKERLDEHLSVKAFGAKGDGITDDTAAFQSCINWCIANNAEIYVPGGDYLIKSTLVFTAGVTMRGKGVSAYTNKTIIRAGTAGMLLCDFQSAENYLVDLLFFGFEPIDVDAVNGYGQGATCNGLRFLRSNGAKDIDSVLRNVIVVSFVTGVSATGANLAIKGFGATACRFPIELKSAASAPDDFRGFVFDDLRFHKCGGNTTTSDSVCVKATGTLKNVMFTNLFADSGCHSLFYGALAEGATIDGVVVRQMDGDCITVVNTGITPSAAYQTYKVTNVSYQTPGSTAINGGWCVILRDAPGGLVTDINTAFTRKGVVNLSNSPDVSISDINGRNINAGTSVDGAIYDGVAITNNSVNCSISNLKIRNSLSSSQARSALFVDSTSMAHVQNISSSNCIATFDGGGVIRGDRFNANSAPSVGWGTSAPTTGAYMSGSIVFTSSPASGGGLGWRCIASGSPGTWEGF
ncbi:glycosyl hydrolase family 28-related protein [Scandinavium goeteborgense]|uniref:Pectate lyase-like protein n=1 Tax=Scandinavium goeteborgense TaxID=1851514 RepID=A0A4R6EZ80_SCAGO|nr:glycosyl hydrolase family 28-related protein [Scandinavium goeteborgense]TDN64236.1 pectate lyase-like protein [Scandinavium goeteborgense]